MMEALKADQEGRLDECIEKDKAALKIEEQPRTRLHLASCESRNGKLVDALKDAQRALEVGIQKRDAGVMKVARTRVKELLDRIPHVTFVPPPGVQDLSVKFDDRPVPLDALTKKFSRRSGQAQGRRRGLGQRLPRDVRRGIRRQGEGVRHRPHHAEAAGERLHHARPDQVHARGEEPGGRPEVPPAEP